MASLRRRLRTAAPIAATVLVAAFFFMRVQLWIAAGREGSSNRGAVARAVETDPLDELRKYLPDSEDENIAFDLRVAAARHHKLAAARKALGKSRPGEWDGQTARDMADLEGGWFARVKVPTVLEEPVAPKWSEDDAMIDDRTALKIALQEAPPPPPKPPPRTPTAASSATAATHSPTSAPAGVKSTPTPPAAAPVRQKAVIDGRLSASFRDAVQKCRSPNATVLLPVPPPAILIGSAASARAPLGFRFGDITLQDGTQYVVANNDYEVRGTAWKREWALTAPAEAAVLATVAEVLHARRMRVRDLSEMKESLSMVTVVEKEVAAERERLRVLRSGSVASRGSDGAETEAFLGRMRARFVRDIVTLGKADLVVDVGSGAGVYGLAAPVFGFPVAMFDPSPACARDMMLAVDENGHGEMVRVFRVAVSSASTTDAYKAAVSGICRGALVVDTRIPLAPPSGTDGPTDIWGLARLGLQGGEMTLASLADRTVRTHAEERASGEATLESLRAALVQEALGGEAAAVNWTSRVSTRLPLWVVDAPTVALDDIILERYVAPMVLGIVEGISAIVSQPPLFPPVVVLARVDIKGQEPLALEGLRESVRLGAVRNIIVKVSPRYWQRYDLKRLDMSRMLADLCADGDYYASLVHPRRAFGVTAITPNPTFPEAIDARLELFKFLTVELNDDAFLWLSADIAPKSAHRCAYPAGKPR